MKKIIFSSKILIGASIEIGLYDIFEYLYDIDDKNNYKYIKLSTINLNIFNKLYNNIDKTLFSNGNRKKCIRKAIINNNLEILYILCDDKNLLNNEEEKKNEDIGEDKFEENHFVFLAIKNGNLKILKFLLKFYDTYEHNIIIYDYDSYGYHNGNKFMLEFAVKCNKFDIVKFLIKKGEDIHLKYNNALRTSLINKNLEIAKYLIDNGANVNDIQEDAQDGEEHFYSYMIDEEIGLMNIDIVKFLFKNGANISGYSMLQAIDNNNLEMVKLLFKNGANINNSDSNIDSDKEVYINTKNYVYINWDTIRLNSNISLPLIEASDKRYIEIVDFFIDNGLNEISINFHLLNHYIINDNLEKVKYFIDNNINFELSNLFGRAVTNKSIKIIIYLLQSNLFDNLKNLIRGFIRDLRLLHNLDIIKIIYNISPEFFFEEYDKKKFQPIYSYSYKNKEIDIDILNFFVSKFDIDIDSVENYSHSLIEIASENGDFEMVKYLATYKYANVNNISRALINASDFDNIEIANYLYENGANIFSKRYHRMNIAIKNNDLDEIKILSHKDSNLLKFNNNTGYKTFNNLLCKAAKNNCIDIIKFLITLPNLLFISYNTACLEALKNNHLKTALDLIKNFPKSEKFFIGVDCIRKLIYKNFFDLIKYLMNNKLCEKYILTACMPFAIDHGDLNIIKYIFGYNNELKDEYIITASEKGYLDVIEFLIVNKIDINYKDNKALKTAAENGNLDAVIVLLKHGANIHADEDYPLRYAAKNGHFLVVKYLIENGANVKVFTKNMLKNIIQKDHIDIYKFLKNHCDLNIL